jgi:hypothetical protein
MPLYREPRPQGCSFCGRAFEQARGIVAGEGVGICDECVALAAEVLRERGVLTAPPKRPGGDRTPRERSIGWLTSPQGVVTDDEAVLVDLTAELDLEITPEDSPDVRWPAVGR